MTTTPMHERNHPVTTAPPRPEQLRKTERVLRLIWVIAIGAIVFSMLTVTPLVQRVTEDAWRWTAPILPLVVDAAVIIVVRMDSEVSRLGAKAGGWATVLRWMTGLFTLGLNIGDSALKGNLVGVAIHAVAPMLLIATSEAIPRYRRTIALGLERIAREQADEQRRREQSAAAEQDREREAREQQQLRREQLERERLEAEDRRVREQRDHEARLAREQREFEAGLEQQRQEREDNRRREEQARQDELARLEREANERRERARRAEREQAAQARREQQPAPVREHPAEDAPPVHEQAPAPARERHGLRSVNTPPAKPVNTDRAAEADAVNTIRKAVESGEVSIRGLARETGWSVGWVSGQVAKARGDDNEPAATEDEQVPA
jgi:hypothetical protein